MPEKIDCSKKDKYNCKNVDGGDKFFKIFDDTMPEMKKEVASASSRILDENIVAANILDNIEKISDKNRASILYQEAREESGLKGQLSDTLYMCNKNYYSKDCPKSNKDLDNKFNQIKKDNSIQGFTNLKEGFDVTVAATNIAADNENIICNSDINVRNIMNKYINDLSYTYSYFKKTTDTYSSLFREIELIQSVKKEKYKEMKKVTDKIDNYKKYSSIDGRKIHYSDEEYKNLNTVFKFVVFFYYLVFIFAIIASNFIGNKLYTNRIILLLTILYIIFPFFIRHFIKFIIEIILHITEKINIEKDVVSYNDVI
jgi:hypothetical protein